MTYLEQRRLMKLGQKVSEKKEPEPKKKESANVHPRLLRKAQEAFNLFIRMRDKKKGCICGCGKDVEQSGHFYPMANYSGVRFDETNCQGIAESCNYYGNEAIDPAFEAGLIERIGTKEVNALHLRAKETKLKVWEREELEALAAKYEQKARALAK